MHPMAGKEKSGVFYSDYSIFKNANMIIIQNELNSAYNKSINYLVAKISNKGAIKSAKSGEITIIPSIERAILPKR